MSARSRFGQEVWRLCGLGCEAEDWQAYHSQVEEEEEGEMGSLGAALLAAMRRKKE